MCLECDGYSFEQVMLDLDLTIRTFGWQLTQVSDPAPISTLPWSYTIGLGESYDHAELMMIGVELGTQSMVIRRVVAMIEERGQIDHDELARLGLSLVEVHRNHLRDHWFGTWSRRYGEPPPDGTFLQIVPPSDWFCECHQHSVPRFDRPAPIRFGNRAERRRQRRR